MNGLLFPAASLPWLVWQDVKLKARGQAGQRAKIILFLVLAILPLAGGMVLAFRHRAVPMLPVAALGQVAAVQAGMALVMLSSAYAHVLRMGRDRAELELLLSAPIPAARAITARISSIHALVALPFLMLTTPYFLASAIMGHWRWLAGPLVVAAIAVLATAAALIIAAGLDRLLGPARARLAAQVTGVLLGAGMFVLGQAPNLAPRWFAAFLDSLAQPPPWPLDLPARALFGDGLPLLLLVALAVLAVRAAAGLAASRLEAAPAPDATAQGRAARFGGSPMAVMFRKEWRLLARDPELVAQIGQQLVFMVPVVALLFSGGQITAARLAAAGVFVGGALASSLAWLVIAAEDAPDLIASAPLRPRQVLMAKLAAALAPPMLLVLALAAIVVVRQPLAALLMLPMALAAGLFTASMQLWTRPPARRTAFRQRYRTSLLMTVGEFLVLGCLAAATNLMLAGSLWALAALALPLLMLAGVWRFRIRPA
jgi:ABC-2 type transport system permease protein